MPARVGAIDGVNVLDDGINKSIGFRVPILSGTNVASVIGVVLDLGSVHQGL